MLAFDVAASMDEFVTFTPGMGDDPNGLRRFLVTLYQGQTKPVPMGFVFSRKSGRWGASVVCLPHPFAQDTKCSVTSREEALAFLVDAFNTANPANVRNAYVAGAR